jgi:hypothetical protein
MSMSWVNFVGWFCWGCGIVAGAVGMAIYIGLKIDREQRRVNP